MDVPAEAAEPAVNIALSQALELLNPAEAAARRAEVAAAPPPDAPAGLPSFPLFILEPLLPGQVMTLHVFEPRYIRLTQRALSEPRLQRSFGMVCSTHARQSGLATHGVEARILEHSDAGGGRYYLRVQGKRRFRILRTWSLDGYRNAAIAWATDGPPALVSTTSSSSSTTATSLSASTGHMVAGVAPAEDATAVHSTARSATSVEVMASLHGAILAAELRSTLMQWLIEVQSGWERREGQIERLLRDLGPMPQSNEIERLGLWGAACINPLPVLGLAPEVRCVALEASEPLARMRLVLAATETSLSHMRLSATSFTLGRMYEWISPSHRPWRVTALLVGLLALGASLLQEPAVLPWVTPVAVPEPRLPELDSWFLAITLPIARSVQSVVNMFGFL